MAPRPIAWVTTLDPDRSVVNAAPFSWFQAVCADPPMVVLALAHRIVTDAAGVRVAVPKDTLRNIEATGEFVVNVATAENAEAVVASSADYPPDVSEVEALGLATTPSARVAPPRLAQSPVHLECRLVETKRLGGTSGSTLVIGEVVHFAADDAVLDARGNVDPGRVPFLARMGGRSYAEVRQTREMGRPRI